MPTIHVVFLLLPKVHLLDLAGAAQVFYEANQLGGQRFRLTFAAADKQVYSEQGLGFGPLVEVQSLSLGPRDLICVPGIDFAGFQQGELKKPIEAIRDWVWQQRQRGARIASICSGALVLAELGLLDRHPCTTHWKCLDYLRQHYPLAHVLDDHLYVGHNGIFTSAGMTAGVDLTLVLIEQWVNPLLAAHVARELVVPIRRQEIRNQQHIFLNFKNTMNVHVYQAQQIIENRLADNPTAEEIAAELHLSTRHLSRLFKEQTGLSIQAYKNRRRLELARQLLEHSGMSVKEAAVHAGYGDASQLSKAWKKRWKGTPGRARASRDSIV